MLSIAVSKLHEPDVLVPMLQQLGKRHAGYGVARSHYGTVGAALLKTLEQGLGDKFTDDTRTAWAGVYGVMVKAMAPEVSA
jgi:hemoglobin-like flavoprotein